MDTEKINDCINTLLFNSGELKSQDAKDIIDVLHQCVKLDKDVKELQGTKDIIYVLRQSLKAEEEKYRNLQKELTEARRPMVMPKYIMSEREELRCKEYFMNDIYNIGMYTLDNVVGSITHNEKEMCKIQPEISADMRRESGSLHDYDETIARLYNRRRDCVLRLRVLNLRKKELEIESKN